jgi:hypothetical protein
MGSYHVKTNLWGTEKYGMEARRFEENWPFLDYQLGRMAKNVPKFNTNQLDREISVIFFRSKLGKIVN